MTDERTCGRGDVGPGRLEAFVASIIGILHAMAYAPGYHVQQQTDMGRGIWRCKTTKIAQIIGVEREDMGEAKKIGAFHLTRPIGGDVDAIAARGRLRATIGRSTDMPITRAG